MQMEEHNIANGTAGISDVLSNTQTLFKLYPPGSHWLKILDDRVEFYKVEKIVISNSNFAYVKAIRIILNPQNEKIEYSYDRYNECSMTEFDYKNLIQIDSDEFETVLGVMDNLYTVKLAQISDRYCLFRISEEPVDVTNMGLMMKTSVGEKYYYSEPTGGVFRIFYMKAEEFAGNSTNIKMKQLTCDLHYSDVVHSRDSRGYRIYGFKEEEVLFESLKHDDLYEITKYQYDELGKLIDMDPSNGLVSDYITLMKDKYGKTEN